VALLAASICAAISCSSSSKNQTAVLPTHIQGTAGYGGTVVIDSVTTNGIIVSLDPGKRGIQLRFPDGSTGGYTAGPEVVNFGRLKVGDTVTTTVSEQMALDLAKAGAPSTSTNIVSVVRGPAGIGGTAVEVKTVTGKIVSFDFVNNLVVLQLANGQNRTIKLVDFVNPSMFNPGDMVTAKVTESRVFSVRPK
jgi:hypothetical protein